MKDIFAKAVEFVKGLPTETMIAVTVILVLSLVHPMLGVAGGLGFVAYKTGVFKG